MLDTVDEFLRGVDGVAASGRRQEERNHDQGRASGTRVLEVSEQLGRSAEDEQQFWFAHLQLVGRLDRRRLYPPA
jgi:hypothetical protein